MRRKRRVRTSAKEGLMQQDGLAPLREASQGLLYPSETDAPFEPFSWGKAEGDLTPQKAARLAGVPAGAPVEQQSLADFFKYLTADGAENADKYKKLQQAIGATLSGARVFRIGRVNIDVYIVGKTKDGHWAGLKTRSVET
jgi:Nuclease A inhibitor-like protein